ncbi:conserved hypothetical protein [Microsporum canis CBS 113480]|uniref:GAT domain-containing protein n=1 Tax=Arthroderma otae (strain ATCC MYA-4605 / CBS 113480) TaxID=554155 RepID=C5FV41_ARTOC|nr:conserved hypothetical protein [Microsporum canis CBS 113480]EEQ33775.1 conserved hypothetical protein [Microsporum canis CBS 113480]
MKRFIGTITTLGGLGAAQPNDAPEVAVLKAVENDYLSLPTIVEAAESSPAAAKVAANQIQKYISKPATSHPQRQYNAIMLIRILADNPGPSFTRNLDARFTACVKVLLRDGRDMNVAQILRETLEMLSTTKADDSNLSGLIQMWNREKEKFEKTYGYPPFGIPPAQMLMSTPVSEFYNNDMLMEFATRCQSASRSVQGYINSSNPAPDEDTMLTLIETNDKISVALSRYNRAALEARKAGFKSPSELAEPGQYLIDHIPDHNQNNNRGQHQNPDYRSGQPSLQTTGPLPVGDTGPEPVQPKKQRYIPRLSMPRMPKKLSKTSPSQAPVQNEETKPTLYTPPAHTANAERTPASPPVSPPETYANNMASKHSCEAHDSYANGTSQLINSNSSNHHADTSNMNHLPHTTIAPPISWEYNPNEFQVENPFADKFATDANSGTDSNRVSRIVEHDGTDAATTADHDELNQSAKRGRYYSQDFNLFDNTKQTPSEALALAPGSNHENKPTNHPSAHT